MGALTVLVIWLIVSHQPTLASTMKGLTTQVMIESRHRADTRTLKKLLVALIVDVIARFWTWRTLRTLDKHRRCFRYVPAQAYP